MSREASDYMDEFDAFFDKYYPAMVRSLTMISGELQTAGFMPCTIPNNSDVITSPESVRPTSTKF